MNKKENISGVILNAYPDSLGGTLSGAVELLQRPELEKAFSLFYLLPSFFNSDLDRGFSVIDYGTNKNLVSDDDLQALEALEIGLKLDIVLNHLSVASPQFKDLIANGDASKYKDFFINWNEFWQGNGTPNSEGIIIPEKQFLDKLFLRKSGLPILNVLFPDGSERPYWNTFYQKISYEKITPEELSDISSEDKKILCETLNASLEKNQPIDYEALGVSLSDKEKIQKLLQTKRHYLGQMDVNAQSALVWDFYEEVLEKMKNYGCKVLRLDAFAYLHKAVGESNFFNTPGTWDYLGKINGIATKNGLQLLPEIHAEYGAHLHDEVAEKGYLMYDFFLPGLLIHTLEKHNNKALLNWANEIIDKKFKVVNMLGCHDGIPLLDLKGKTVNGSYREGLLTDAEIDDLMELVMARGGRVKNLYGTDGKKIAYYQVNATYFSALGEDKRKLLLARAIQLFMPGIPQVWYLDLFAGKNDYQAVERAGQDGHKEINRTNLSEDDIAQGLQQEIVRKQLELIRLRNTSSAFAGTVEFLETSENKLHIKWTNGSDFAVLKAGLENYSFEIETNTEKISSEK